MKPYPRTPLKGLASLFVAMTCLLAASTAKANLPILLTINITDPNNVVIASTGNDPSQSVSGDIGAGFDLMGLLGAGIPSSSDLSYSGNLASTLTTGATGTELTFNAGIYDTLNGQNDINLYNTGNTTNLGMTFNTSAPAFEPGTSLVTDLAALTLLPVGSIGNIETGFDGSASPSAFNTPNTVIGSYEVVNDTTLSSTPEPASWTLALIVTALLAVLRFRTRRA